MLTVIVDGEVREPDKDGWIHLAPFPRQRSRLRFAGYRSRPAVGLGLAACLLLVLFIGATTGWAIAKRDFDTQIEQVKQSLLSQYAALVRALGFDEPFVARFSAVGQRQLQLDLSLNTDAV